MEQGQEHIATLCAVGTIGIAATGLALGTAEADTFLIKPGKRKAPGGDTAYSPNPSNLPFAPRRAISQPVAPSTIEHKISRTPSTSLFRRKTLRGSEHTSTGESLLSESRGSSLSRHGILRSFSGARDSSTERKETRPGSSWLKRMSAMSSLHSSSPTSSMSKLDITPSTSTPPTYDLDKPNKLVKRASSIRALSSDHARGFILRRPATSHQRSVSLLQVSTSQPTSQISAMDVEQSEYVSTTATWRPFFDTGYARKRHTSGGPRDKGVRTVSSPYGRTPTLVNGRAVQRVPVEDGIDDRKSVSSPTELSPVNPQHRLRRSLGSVRRNGRQRNFTDPVVHVSKDEAYGSILPTTKPSPLSPMSNVSTFEIDFPHGTPIFTSSPPSQVLPQQSFAVNKRISIAQSEPTTISSDNDPRVFTDDDSMDYQSDAAYDSLATRATASSHSGFRQSKIETIFDDPTTDLDHQQTATLEQMMQQSNLNDSRPKQLNNRAASVGIGISGLSEHDEEIQEAEDNQSTTPVKTSGLNLGELNATPVPFRVLGNSPELASSPPSSVHRYSQSKTRTTLEYFSEEMAIDNQEHIEWSPKSDREAIQIFSGDSTSSPNRISFDHRTAAQDSDFKKRLSIFDWSEQQRSSGEVTNGFLPRPKTVHGKQGNEIGRSRPPGRKGPSAIHLRSQSVPVNRDNMSDSELPPSAMKFGTWGLGNKPVSEEWSDDFEFDDVEEVEEQQLAMPVEKPLKPAQRDSVRSVKVPQSIIDRQASVHLQFGQVQEFMLLVEELKRLRIQGSSLQLLESHSRQLWEDAENIISLATLNEEDEVALRPVSPTSSDIFGDETPPSNRIIKDVGMRSEDSKRNSPGRRSTSNFSTPPFARARGESLAQAKSFLQTIHQSRGGNDSSPAEIPVQPREKLPFDTQDLRDLVIRAGVITRALKEIVRKAEGVSVSPQRTPQKLHDPSFSQLFNPPDASPCPPFKKPVLPKSRSANSYLGSGAGGNNESDMPQSLKFAAVIEAN